MKVDNYKGARTSIYLVAGTGEVKKNLICRNITVLTLRYENIIDM